MHYVSYSLNGTWEMTYLPEAYTGTAVPDASLIDMAEAPFSPIAGAVPGYWEDMTEAFAAARFFRMLRVNPEFGLWQYPIAGYCPDMALPNIIGNFFYRRVFSWSGENPPTQLYFGGVQNAVSVWLNGIYLGRHEGYAVPFDVAIPNGVLCSGENTLILSVSNTPIFGYHGELISGITNRAACEGTGGIYGDVELRFYPTPLRDVGIFVAPDTGTVTVKPEVAESCSLSWHVTDGETVLLSGTAEGAFTFSTEKLETWSPESPKLYTLWLGQGENMLCRRFGVRALTIHGSGFLLNGKPYYLRGICEHCYYPDTVNPWQDVKKYRAAIRKLKALGFNYIRFHTHVPSEEYLTAADELGMLVHVESPNNTSLEQWREMVEFARRHTSAVIYCCGNEMMMDEPFIDHLRSCADTVHELTDALFAPLSAMRGLEYMLDDPKIASELSRTPFEHHPGRFSAVSEFADMYSSYTLGHHSYFSTKGDPAVVDSWAPVYQKPRVSHEICIDGTYVDLSLKDRYKNSRIRHSRMFESIEQHLQAEGLLEKAPLYFRNSVQWQRRVRKHCFENTRRCKTMAGYDFLGPIDTHWHTYGYDCGMMNEFYELKPGETERNVRMYNSATVLLSDLGTRYNFYGGEELVFSLSVSHFGDSDLAAADLTVRITCKGKTLARRHVSVDAKNGAVTELYRFRETMPAVREPKALTLSVTLDGGDTYAENEWELYLFPRVDIPDAGEILVSDGMTEAELLGALKAGRDVLLLGGAPFDTRPTSFRMSLAGRTSGNLATVIADHPLTNAIPHEGFCAWQFAPLLDDGKTVVFAQKDIPFAPIIETVSSHKNAVRQAALFEYEIMNGRLLVCTFDLTKNEPMSRWLRAKLIAYMHSADFAPRDTLDQYQLHGLITAKANGICENTNLAFNVNDKTAHRKKQ